MSFLKKIVCLLILVFINAYSITASNYYEFLNLNKPYSEFDNEKLKVVKQLLDSGYTKKALEKLYVFIDEVERKKDIKLKIEGNILLADIFRENGDYQKSNETYNSVLPLIKSDFEKLQYVFFKKGGNFQLENQIDSAKSNYEKAILYSKQINSNQDLKAKIYANLSGVFYLQGNYDKAIENFKIAANFQKLLGNKNIEAGILNNLGGIYYMQGKHKDALSFFDQAFNLVGYGQDELQKKTRSVSFLNMAYAYSGLGNYKKAFEFQDKYFSLNDSLLKELKYKEIAEIESKYNVATKEKEAEIEKSKRKDVEFIAFGLGLSIFLLMSGIYVLYKLNRLNKRNHALQISQGKLMNQNRIEKIKSESQVKILVATLDGRIDERKKISEVLHDNVSALLSAANLHLYASRKQLKDTVPVEIDKTQSIISEASELIRSLSHKLISSVLVKFGLVVAIQDICEKSSNSSILINCNSRNIGRFDQNFEIKVFNIINELINNILKHSNAKNGTVKLEQLNGQLQVIVFDDGDGFDLNVEKADSGIGLSQVKARIEVLKGLMNIKSSENGTRIYLSIPIVY